MLLAPDFTVADTSADYYVQFGVSGGNPQLRIRLPSSQANTQIDTDLSRLLKPAAWVEVGDFALDITNFYNRAVVGTSLTFSFNYRVVSGTQPAANMTLKLRVVGEDVHRGQIARQSFKVESPSVSGLGGALGRVWAYVSSATNAAWTAATRVLLDSVQATRATVDRGKIFAVKSDDENDLELTQLFDKSETESITNFDTGNQTLTGSTVCQAPDAIVMPDIDDDLIEAENISGFGTVYRLKHAASSIRITMKANPSVGVALRIRSVTTKPTASDNANTLGTQLAQNGGQGSQVTVTTTQTNVAADTYFFFQPSAGPRTLTQREVQFDQASYSKVTTETGLVTGGSAGQVLQRKSDNSGVEFAAAPAAGPALVASRDDLTIETTGWKDLYSDGTTTTHTFADDDVITVVAWENAGQGKTSVFGPIKVSSLRSGTSQIWLGVPDSGKRFQIRRKGTTGDQPRQLQASFATSNFNADNRIEIWKWN